MFGIDKSTGAADLLHFSNHLERKRRLTGRLWAIYFNNTAARQSTHPKREIKTKRTGRNDLNVLLFYAVGHAHDRTFAKLLFNARKRGVQCFFALIAFFAFNGILARSLGGHIRVSSSKCGCT